LLIFSGKGAKLPSKLRITVHRDMKILQIGIWISPSIWVQFKIGFSHYLEDHSIYNFPIYGFWSLCANSWEQCKQRGVHALDWAEDATTRRRARVSTRCRRAAAVRRLYHGAPGSQRVSATDVRFVRALQDAASAREPSTTRRVPAYPRVPRLPSPSLDPTQASTTAHWSSLPRASPETKPQRARHRDLAAASHQSHLRPRNHHQSPRGEPNRTLVPFICQA
jgi:hypothetical protein